MQLKRTLLLEWIEPSPNKVEDIYEELVKLYRKKTELAYGACSNCENLSTDLSLAANGWLCEDCRDEIMEVDK
ncbi:MAG: hypothetical protein HYW22_00465 [Candidatus Aenigmarchaeota archaeon]|nr:hypothetical protein [Candidatus Aenigmarchaeota archaeon]